MEIYLQMTSTRISAMYRSVCSLFKYWLARWEEDELNYSNYTQSHCHSFGYKIHLDLFVCHLQVDFANKAHTQTHKSHTHSQSERSGEYMWICCDDRPSTLFVYSKLNGILLFETGAHIFLPHFEKKKQREMKNL